VKKGGRKEKRASKRGALDYLLKNPQKGIRPRRKKGKPWKGPQQGARKLKRGAEGSTIQGGFNSAQKNPLRPVEKRGAGGHRTQDGERPLKGGAPHKGGDINKAGGGETHTHQ